MDKREFLEKWFKDNGGMMNPSFMEDLESVLDEEKELNPLQRFIEDWMPRLYNTLHFAPFKDDLLKVVAWAKREGQVYRGPLEPKPKRGPGVEKAEERLDSRCNSYNTRKSSIEKKEPKAVEWYPTPGELIFSRSG
jgi:hypothetical protein